MEKQNGLSPSTGMKALTYTATITGALLLAGCGGGGGGGDESAGSTNNPYQVAVYELNQANTTVIESGIVRYTDKSRGTTRACGEKADEIWTVDELKLLAPIKKAAGACDTASGEYDSSCIYASNRALRWEEVSQNESHNDSEMQFRLSGYEFSYQVISENSLYQKEVRVANPTTPTECENTSLTFDESDILGIWEGEVWSIGDDKAPEFVRGFSMECNQEMCFGDNFEMAFVEPYKNRRYLAVGIIDSEVLSIEATISPDKNGIVLSLCPVGLSPQDLFESCKLIGAHK